MAPALAGRYALLYMAGLPASAAYEALRRYLSAMQVVRPLIVIAGIGTVFHGVLAWLLIHRFGLGFDYMQRYPDIVRAITVEQVREAAERHLHPDKLVVVSAGAS